MPNTQLREFHGFMPESDEVIRIQLTIRSDGYEIWKNSVENIHKAARG
jgi:hypothetical protein